MCGILIWLNKHHRVDPSKFSRALELLKHRGPDAQRMLFFGADDDKVSGDIYDLGEHLPSDLKFGALGHTRLSILDLRSAAHQPFISDSRKQALVYNGEIYNYKEEAVRHGLEKDCVTSSDTEVLFRALLKEGEPCLRTMNGMWAFGFLDFAKRELLLSRDNYGKKPLFIYSDDENFIASSEIKAIYSILGIKRSLERRALAGLLISKLMPTFDDGTTVYKDIHFLPAGANLRFDLANFRYEVSRENDLSYWLNQDANIDDFEEEVERAVRLRLRSDVPVAIAVSGGVDSTVVAANAVKQAESPDAIRFFTIRNFDENNQPKEDLRYARIVAKNLGISLTEVELPIEDSDFQSSISNMVRQYEFPQNPFLISWPLYLLNRKMAETGIKVALDGTGGDEILGGYPAMHMRMAENFAAKRNLVKAASHWRRWERYSSNGGHRIKPRNYLRLARLALKGAESKYFPERSVFSQLSPYLKDQTVRVECEHLLNEFFGRQKSFTSIESQTFEIRNFLLPYALYINDQYSMAWSIENRSPLLDINLIKYVNLPDDQKSSLGYNKYFLRQSMPSIVSNEVRWRRDKDGMAVNPNYLMNKHRSYVNESVFSSQLVRELVNVDVVEDHMKKGCFPTTLLRGLFALSVLEQTYECGWA